MLPREPPSKTLAADCALLGLDKGTPLVHSTVHKAFLKQALTHHPDKSEAKDRPAKNKVFQSIKEAHDRLIGRISLEAAANERSPCPATASSAAAMPTGPKPLFQQTDSLELRKAKQYLKRKGCELRLDAACNASVRKRRQIVHNMSVDACHGLSKELTAREAVRSQFQTFGSFPVDSAVVCEETGLLVSEYYKLLIPVFSSKEQQWAPGEVKGDRPEGLRCDKGVRKGWKVTRQGRNNMYVYFQIETYKSWELCFRLAELQLAVWHKRDSDSPKRDQKQRHRETSNSILAKLTQKRGISRTDRHETVVAGQKGYLKFERRFPKDVSPEIVVFAHMLQTGLKHCLPDAYLDQHEQILRHIRQFEDSMFGGFPLPFQFSAKFGDKKTILFPTPELAVDALCLMRAQKMESQDVAQVEEQPPAPLDRATAESQLLRELREYAGNPPMHFRMREKGAASLLLLKASQRSAADTDIRQSNPCSPSVSSVSEVRQGLTPACLEQVLPFLAERLPLWERLQRIHNQWRDGLLDFDQHAIAVQRTLGESLSRLQVPHEVQRSLQRLQMPESEWPDIWLATLHHFCLREPIQQALADVCARRSCNLALQSAQMTRPSLALQSAQMTRRTDRQARPGMFM